jgi:hypothetical protein
VVSEELHSLVGRGESEQREAFFVVRHDFIMMGNAKFSTNGCYAV